MENLILTNSALIRANQCNKSYYLNLYYPELRDESVENHRTLSERRKVIAKLTNHLFPNGKYSGVDVTGSCEMSYVHTKELINSDAETIYNACFKHEELFCFVDVLHRDSDTWNAYGIWDKDDPDSHIILTGTFQHCIMQRNGINIRNCFSIVYNTSRSNEGVIDLTYEIVSITNKVTGYQPNLNNKITEIRKISKKDSIPDISPGKHCTTPNKCDFYNYCKFSVSNN